MLPNPVGPEAITAIVVIVCLSITAVLAAFFFWPKCHIADPAAEAIKKLTKPPSAREAAAAARRADGGATHGPPAIGGGTAYDQASGGGASGAAGGGGGGHDNVVYDNREAAIKLPAISGPSAA